MSNFQPQVQTNTMTDGRTRYSVNLGPRQGWSQYTEADLVETSIKAQEHRGYEAAVKQYNKDQEDKAKEQEKRVALAMRAAFLTAIGQAVTEPTWTETYEWSIIARQSTTMVEETTAAASKPLAPWEIELMGR